MPGRGAFFRLCPVIVSSSGNFQLLANLYLVWICKVISLHNFVALVRVAIKRFADIPKIVTGFHHIHGPRADCNVVLQVRIVWISFLDLVPGTVL